VAGRVKSDRARPESGVTPTKRAASDTTPAGRECGAWNPNHDEGVPRVAPESQHFGIQVSDLDSAVACIEAHGIAVRTFGGRTLPGAGRQASLRDPSGNSIELNQPD